MIQENNTIFIGKVLLDYQELDSTNEFALHLMAQQKLAAGTVVLAQQQSAGRGQRGSSWESAPFQNLTLSIVLYPKFLLVREQFLLNQVISLGVRDCVQYFLNKKVQVKWSNDIYVGHKKIAGILIQNTISSTSIQSSVIGIGLNVNQTAFISGAPNPTSLGLEAKTRFDLVEVREKLFSCIEKWYLQLKAGKKEFINTSYLQHLYLFQQESIFQDVEGKRFKGTIVGINELGMLKIATPKGVFLYNFKEIKFIIA